MATCSSITVALTCIEGYFKKTDNTCATCTANVAICTDATTATKCKSTYFLDNKACAA